MLRPCRSGQVRRVTVATAYEQVLSGTGEQGLVPVQVVLTSASYVAYLGD